MLVRLLAHAWKLASGARVVENLCRRLAEQRRASRSVRDISGAPYRSLGLRRNRHRRSAEDVSDDADVLVSAAPDGLIACALAPFAVTGRVVRLDAGAYRAEHCRRRGLAPTPQQRPPASSAKAPDKELTS